MPFSPPACPVSSSSRWQSAAPHRVVAGYGYSGAPAGLESGGGCYATADETRLGALRRKTGGGQVKHNSLGVRGGGWEHIASVAQGRAGGEKTRWLWRMATMAGQGGREGELRRRTPIHAMGRAGGGQKGKGRNGAAPGYRQWGRRTRGGDETKLSSLGFKRAPAHKSSRPGNIGAGSGVGSGPRMSGL